TGTVGRGRAIRGVEPPSQPTTTRASTAIPRRRTESTSGGSTRTAARRFGDNRWKWTSRSSAATSSTRTWTPSSTRQTAACSAVIYGWPMPSAADIAVQTVRATANAVDEVRFVLFSDDAYDEFARALAAPS